MDKKKTLQTLQKKPKGKKKTIKTWKKKRKKKALSKPDVFREFVAWMSVFGPLRDPKTQGGFAEKFQVSENTLSDWKKRDDFWEAVAEAWSRWGREKTSNVMQRFYQKIIKEGMTPDFKLWFQYFLKWSEKAEIKHSGKVEEEVSASPRLIKLLEKKDADGRSFAEKWRELFRADEKNGGRK